MLYPVAPLELDRLVEKLNAASDAEDLPRPTIGRPEGSYEETLEAVRRHVGAAEPADPPLADQFAFTSRAGGSPVVAVKWPKPLRTTEGEMVLFTGSVPVGPDPLAMWQAMFLLTPVP